jgi:hypothetical protein
VRAVIWKTALRNTTGAVRRPHQQCNHARQPTATVVFSSGRHAAQPFAPPRAARYRHGQRTSDDYSLSPAQARRSRNRQRTAGGCLIEQRLSAPGAIRARARQLAGKSCAEPLSDPPCLFHAVGKRSNARPPSFAPNSPKFSKQLPPPFSDRAGLQFYIYFCTYPRIALLPDPQCQTYQ